MASCSPPPPSSLPRADCNGGSDTHRPACALCSRLGSSRRLPARLGWLLRDYAKRVWDNSGEDNVLFVAGGIAFNILLAVVPFFLLLATGLVYLLDHAPDTTSAPQPSLAKRLMIGPALLAFTA